MAKVNVQNDARKNLPATKVAEGERTRETHPCPDCGAECACVLEENHCWHECAPCDCGHELEDHEGHGRRECGKCSCSRYTSEAANPSPAVDAGEPLPPPEYAAVTETVSHHDYCQFRNWAFQRIRALEQRLAESEAEVSKLLRESAEDFNSTEDQLTANGKRIVELESKIAALTAAIDAGCTKIAEFPEPYLWMRVYENQKDREGKNKSV
jgi:hypothetical protein